MSAPAQFSLAREAHHGEFRRQDSVFRDWLSTDGSTAFSVEAGRYHLYVARACPWAHRTIIARRLMGLEEVIGISFVDPFRDERGWRFSGGEYVDPVNRFEFLAEAYAASDPGYQLRVSVPVLWDKQTSRIVNNESGDILRMLCTVLAPAAAHPVELVPQSLRGEIDELNRFLYDRVNNAVYKTGFATRQEVYEREANALFAALEELDRRLAERRYLLGPEPTESDIRLFTTLVRFDAVYQVHFKCSRRKLIEYEHLWPYTRDLFQRPGFGDTVALGEIRTHYYRTHPSINPSGIVALAPDQGFAEPHRREGM